MPAIITHDFFGHDAIPAAASALGFGSEAESKAFILGNQGPDPLFYLLIDPFISSESRVGELMHHARPTELLAAISEAASATVPSARGVARAYAAGFVCHYLLDRTVHPFVYYWQRALCAAGIDGLDDSDGGNVHAEIERDLDEAVLFGRRGLTIAEYRPYEEILIAEDSTLAIIDGVVFDAVLAAYGRVIDRRTFSHAVKSFRIMQRIFWSPTGKQRDLLGATERTLGGDRYSLVCAMSHRVRREGTSVFGNDEHATWANPFTGEVRSDSFDDLYDRALSQVPEAFDVLLSGEIDREAVARFTGGINFSGEPAYTEA